MTEPFGNLLGAALLMLAVLATAHQIARRSAFYRAELSETKSRELALDGLRGIAALVVMAHHASIYWSWYRTDKWGNAGSAVLQAFGPGGVLIFFMLTGYLFWNKARAGGGRFKVWNLWRGRLRRIAPLYWFSAVVILGICFWKIRFRMFNGETWLPILRISALGAANWFPIGGVPVWRFNASVAWTLWYEWRFYLILPFVAWFALGWRMVWLAIVAVFLVVLSPNTSDVWLVFFLGMACAVLLDDPKTRAPLCRPKAAIGALVGVVVFCYLLRDFFIPSICFGGALFPLFLVVAAGNGIFGFLTHPATRCLGAISYSLYLLHGVVFYFAVNGLKLFGPAGLTATGYWAFMIGAAIMTALICAATYLWIESPFMRKR